MGGALRHVPRKAGVVGSAEDPRFGPADAGGGVGRPAGPWPSARAPVAIVLFALVYAAAVFVGRLSRLPGTTLALVWPAAAAGA